MVKLLILITISLTLFLIVSQNEDRGRLIAGDLDKSAPTITPTISIQPQIDNSPTPKVTPSALVIQKPKIIPPESSALLPPGKYVYQTFNNCGPATLSMLLDFYGINATQQEIAESLRPYNNRQGYNDDRSVTLDELAGFTKTKGLFSYKRPNGDLEKIKLFISNGVPVITITWIEEKNGFGHFRIIKGYDDSKQQIIQDDSIFGQEKSISYDEFLRLWQIFNYNYLVIVPPEKDELVKAILADDLDEKIAYTNSLNKSISEDNTYAVFNQAINYYYLAEYEKSVRAFESVRSALPYRLIWYQIEPVLAYHKLKKYDQVFALSENIIQSGNPSFSELYQLRGEVYMERGEQAKAKKELGKAILYNKNNYTAQRLLSLL